jgi:hypothetical protein
MRWAHKVLLATTATIAITGGVIYIVKKYFSEKLTPSERLFRAIESMDFPTIKASLITEEDALIAGSEALLTIKNREGHTPLEALLRSELWPKSPRGDVWKRGYNCVDILYSGIHP